jgi:hypothetical protein
MALIDFVGIGAPKCGTTWLSAQLEAHPQVGFAPAKEVYYFADTIARRLAGKELRCYERGPAWYHDQFPPAASPVTRRGEFCPSYLYSEDAASRLAAYNPDVKLLLCLRPPVDMIYSWYWFNRNGVVAKLPPTFAEMMENPVLRDLGCYARHLKPYLDRFPAENILVVQFDAIRRDPAAVLKSVYAFIGVDSAFIPEVKKEGKNAARGARFATLQTAAQSVHGGLSRLPGVSRLLKSPAIAGTLQRVYHRFNSKAQKYAPLTAAERARWEQYYASDQQALANLLKPVRVIA